MVDDVTPKQAWAALLADPAAQLIDVRTEAEWAHVGVPDLSSAGKQVALISWQFPTGAVNPAFLEELGHAGLRPDQTLYFLCRSGVRSMAAAHAAESAGYGKCFNVACGFEGRPATLSGWKADGLPCEE